MAYKRLSSKEKTKNGASKKPLMIMLSAVLICTVVVGGTFAYLTWHDAKTNTFTASGVEVSATLSEPNWVESSPLIPGTDIQKDPTVTVKANSQNCYAFMAVKNNLLDSNNSEVGTVTVNADWELVNGTTGYSLYIYKVNNYIVPKSSTDIALTALFNNVSVASGATQQTLNEITDPTVKVAAFLHQSDGTSKDDATNAAIAHFNDSNNWN